MDEGHILIANLSIGALGEGISHLIGALLTSAITTTAFQRIDHASLLTPDDLRRWYLYIDEFQMFSNSGFSRILSQTRKFRLLLTASHQYQGQLPTELNDAVLGNVGTTIVFRVGVNDADHLARHLLLDHHYHDADLKGPHQLLSLPNYQAYIKTLDRGAPVLHHLLPYPEPSPLTTRTERIIANSRALFGRDPQCVQRRIDDAYPAARPSLIDPPKRPRSFNLGRVD